MAKANINDRSSIEKIYTAADWEQDASRNAQGAAAQLHGVKILSAPDGQGMFELAVASQHVGERDPEGDSIFLPAFEPDAAAASDGPTYGGSRGRKDDANDAEDYARFIGRVIETARTARFKPPIGKGDERIKGFRGG